MKCLIEMIGYNLSLINWGFIMVLVILLPMLVVFGFLAYAYYLVLRKVADYYEDKD